MITFQDKPYVDEETRAVLNPLVNEWFFSKFTEFAAPQKFSILNIHKRKNMLISSPTGSGKTLSAFTTILSELITLSEHGNLEDKLYCIYVSPLKALSNDIAKNLQEPLEEMTAMAKKHGKEICIRVGTRTGDTTTAERAKMLKKPPHILITTPESLAIILSSTKFRETLSSVQWVIIDEIHSMANSKRGVHLSLSLERLQTLASFTRIGLSATVSPLDKVAQFLVGIEDPRELKYRDCIVVDVQYLKKLDLNVLSPVENLIDTPFQDVHKKMYELIHKLIQDHKTTLIFTNTRSATERVVHYLKDKFPGSYLKVNEDKDEAKAEKKEGVETSYIGAHHGSLSKEHRFNIENRLKEGKLKCVVCSTSLELGIDIGYIDLVILLGSPKSVARALQRIGRSGHKLHDTAKGRIIVLDRDDLVECSVLLKAAMEKKIDQIDIPMNCLDVLAQQLFGMALDRQWPVEELYYLVKRSYCYHELPKEDFIEVIRYLSGEYASLEDRNVYAKIWFDKETGMIGKRGKLARVLYMTNVGTIPDETAVKVKVKDQFIGRIDEQFLERLKRGDVFVLGGNTYEFLYSQGMTAFVKASINRPPTVPSWFSEMLPLSFDLALEIQKFRRYLEEHFDAGTSMEDMLKFIHSYLYVDEFGARAIYHYLHEQYLFSEISHDKKIVIEHYADEKSKYIIFHTLFGRRTNDVLARAVGFAIGQIQGKDVEMNISDVGFFIRTTQAVQASRALKLIKSTQLRDIMNTALEKTEILGRRFRHCATRALMILRSYRGRTKSVGRQQMSSRLLITAVKKISPDFPILKEARREVLEDLMDIAHAEQVLKWIESGRIQLKETHGDLPSPFAFNLIASGYADIMKIEDKAEFLRRMHMNILAKISLKKGQKSEESWESE
ncbi:MAG: ATP-dependent helicase [archaeon]